MLRPASASRRDMLLDHAIGLIEEKGLSAVTFPAIADRIGLTRQAVTSWAGSRSGLLQLVAGTFGQRWRQWTSGRAAEHGALTFLPATTDEVRWTRILLALDEQERESPELGPVMADLRTGESELLVAIHPELVDEADNGTTLLLVLLAGLRAGLCRADNPFAAEEARSIFWAQCQRVAGRQADWLSPTAPWGARPSLLAGKQAGDGTAAGQPTSVLDWQDLPGRPGAPS